jgi:CO/xanthine dehydrogenase Mo-binding subunit
MELSRRETICSTRTRHAAVVYLKTGVLRDGTFVAQDFRVVANTGAYTNNAMVLIGAMSHKVFKLYKTKNIRFIGMAVYTNKPMAGPMRGYGSPQIFLAQQVQLQKIARALNMDLIDLQLKNLVEPDGVDQRFGKPLGNPRPIDCVKEGASVFHWLQKKEIIGKNSSNQRYKRGIGMAVGLHGSGVFEYGHPEYSTVLLRINDDGSAVLHTGTHEMGTAALTIQLTHPRLNALPQILMLSPGILEIMQVGELLSQATQLEK